MLRAWEIVEEPGKTLASCTKVVQGPAEAFSEFLQRLGSAINRAISDPETRQALILILVYENADNECKRTLRP